MNGIERIAKERQCQVDEEGFSAGRDDKYTGGELALVAACYAHGEPTFRLGPTYAGIYQFSDIWPTLWHRDWDKRKTHSRVRQLQIAGALCAAELDRLIRKEEKENEQSG